ncbi:MAG: FCD domain-containing protein [Gemmatimonadota bacterium]|nr:FCD domain-containing protein [Gemmatimonadota bacterium]
MTADQLKPVSREKLADQVVTILKRFIYVESLNAGDKLPPERKLAANLGVSYRVIREALSILASEDIVVREQGRGTFVRSTVGMGNGDGHLSVFPSISSRSDIYALRIAVEMAAAALAAENATEEDLSELKSIADFKEHDFGQGMMSYEIRFHRALLRATHNPMLKGFEDLIAEALRLKAYDIDIPVFGERHPTREFGKVAIAEHRELVDALSKRDGATATAVMFRQMDSVRALIHGLERKGDGEILQ